MLKKTSTPENRNISSHSNSTHIIVIVVCALLILILLAIITTIILRKSPLDCIRQVNGNRQPYIMCDFTGGCSPNTDNNEDELELNVVNQEGLLT